MRFVLALVAVASITADVHAQTYREPQRAWFSGFGQGIIEAAVRNNNGAELRFSCPAGAEAVKPSIMLSVPTRGPGGDAENLNAVFEIDGVGNEWAFHRKATEDASTEYSFEAFNWRVEMDQERLAEKLRKGRSVIVFIPDDRVMEEFSLVGAGDALAGCAGE